MKLKSSVRGWWEQQAQKKTGFKPSSTSCQTQERAPFIQKVEMVAVDVRTKSVNDAENDVKSMRRSVLWRHSHSYPVYFFTYKL